MGVFTDCQIALELDSSLGFKKKSALKGKIIDNGGTISFIVTKNVSCTSSTRDNIGLLHLYYHWQYIHARIYSAILTSGVIFRPLTW